MSRRDSERKGIGKKRKIIKGNGREVYPRYEVYITGVAKA